jgi:hypothetical protein
MTKQFTVTADNALSADLVANYMMDLIQKKDYPCGTVLEVTLRGHRLIGDWNVPPPSGEGAGTDLPVDDARLKAMLLPVKEKLKTESGPSAS